MRTIFNQEDTSGFWRKAERKKAVKKLGLAIMTIVEHDRGKEKSEVVRKGHLLTGWEGMAAAHLTALINHQLDE